MRFASLGAGFGHLGGSGAVVAQQSGLVAPFPQFFGSMGLANTSVRTDFLKIEVDAPFDGVRLWFFSRESGSSSGWKAKVAPTETFSYSSLANCYHPIINGSQDDTKWVDATHNAAALSSATLPAMASNVSGMLRSDRAAVQSVPRSDGGSTYALLIRVVRPSTGTHSLVSNSGSRWRRMESERWYRRWDCASVSGDTIDTLSTTPATSYDFANNSIPLVAVELYFQGVVVQTVVSNGDSLTAGGGGQISLYDNWLMRAFMDLSRPSKPYTLFNGGISSAPPLTFYSNLSSLLTTGLKGKKLVIPNFSPNLSPVNQTTIDAAVDDMEAKIDLARAAGFTEINGWTSAPNDAYGASPDALRLDSDAQAAALVPSKIDYRYDVNSIVGDNASPERFAAGYGRADGTHWTLLAEKELATLIKDHEEEASYAPETGQLPYIMNLPPVQDALAFGIKARVYGNPGPTSETTTWEIGGSPIGGATNTYYRHTSGNVGSRVDFRHTVSIQSQSIDNLAQASRVVLANKIATPDDITGWTLTGVTAATGGPDPFGGTGGSVFTETSATSAHSAVLGSLSVTNGKRYGLGFVIKNAGLQFAQIGTGSTGFGTNHYGNFDLNTGILGTLGSSIIGGKIIPVPFGTETYGWWLCYMEFLATATTSSASVFIAGISASNSARLQSRTGSGADAYNVWGAFLAQLD